MLHSRQGLRVRLRQQPARRAMFQACVDAAVQGAPLALRERAAAALQVLYSAPFWDLPRTFWTWTPGRQPTPSSSRSSRCWPAWRLHLSRPRLHPDRPGSQRPRAGVTPAGAPGPAAACPKGKETFMTQRYALRGIVRCGVCGRKMQGSWNNGKPYYRCTFLSQCAAKNKVNHPTSVYLRGAAASEDRRVAVSQARPGRVHVRCPRIRSRPAR